MGNLSYGLSMQVDGVKSRNYPHFWTRTINGYGDEHIPQYVLKPRKNKRGKGTREADLRKGLRHFMNDQQLELINNGPFKHFLTMPMTLSLSTSCVHACLELWDEH